jgi:hypothetical protein
MAAPLSQKTFKLELEFTVTVEELDEKHLAPNIPPQALPYLKQLQEAMVKDEQALLQQIMTQITAKLQQYTDHLAAQEDLTNLKQIDANLEIDDRDCFNPSDRDFSELTRPIRISAIKTELESCTLDEKIQDPQGNIQLEPTWSDLWMQSEFTGLMGKYPSPSNSRVNNARRSFSHYLSVQYLTRQKDGIHCDALCSCGRTISGVAEDEASALKCAWAGYQKHLALSNIATVEMCPSEIVSGKN